MAEFAKVMKLYGKLCGSFESCSDCPMNASVCSCATLLKKHPEEAEAIILEWAAKHSRMTMQEAFYIAHPKAPKGTGGHPQTCPQKVGFASDDGCEKGYTCAECWNRAFMED